MYFLIFEHLVVTNRDKKYLLRTLSFKTLIILKTICSKAGRLFFVDNYITYNKRFNIEKSISFWKAFLHLLDHCKYISYSIF